MNRPPLFKPDCTRPLEVAAPAFSWGAEQRAVPAVVIVIAIVIALAFPSPASSSATKLLLATDDTPGNPWIMGGGSQLSPQLPGIEIELYRLMAARLDLRLEMVRMPWKRCLLEVKRGAVDGIFPASFKPERLSLGAYPMSNGKVDPSRKSRDSAYFLYTRKSSPLVWDGHGFANLHLMDRRTIGVPLEWSIVSDLRRLKIKLLEKPRPIELLEMLNRGGLAGVVCLDTAMDPYIAQSPDRFNKVRKTHPAVAKRAYYLLLSHAFASQYPALAEKIWDTLAAIKSEDTFAAIVNRYTH